MDRIRVERHAGGAPRPAGKQAEASERREDVHGFALNLGNRHSDDHDIDSGRLMLRGPVADRPRCHVHGVGGAQIAGERQPLVVSVGHHDPPGAAGFGEHHMQEAHRARAINHDRIAMLDPRGPLRRHDAGERFSQRGRLRVDTLRQRDDERLLDRRRRNRDQWRMGSVAVDAEGRIGRTHVAHALEAHAAVAAADVRGHAHPIADAKALRAAACLTDRAHKLVAERDCLAVAELPVAVLENLEIGAADAGCLDLEDEAALFSDRLGRVGDGEPAPLCVACRDHAFTSAVPQGTGMPVRRLSLIATTASTAQRPSAPVTLVGWSSSTEATKLSISAR